MRREMGLVDPDSRPVVIQKWLVLDELDVRLIGLRVALVRSIELALPEVAVSQIHVQ